LFFDAIFIIYTLANMFLGFRYGLFRRVVHVGAFLLGMLLAQALSPGFAEQFGYNTGTHPADSHFGVFLAILFGIVIIAEVLGFAYAEALGFLNTLLGDRFFGALLGLVASTLQIGIILYLFAQLTSVTLPSGGSNAGIIGSSQTEINNSIVAKQVKRIQEVTLLVFRPVLPPEPVSYFAKTYT
jgi:uncharacterized membrane protein required for colicin V production